MDLFVYYPETNTVQAGEEQVLLESCPERVRDFTEHFRGSSLHLRLIERCSGIRWDARLHPHTNRTWLNAQTVPGFHARRPGCLSGHPGSLSGR